MWCFLCGVDNECLSIVLTKLKRQMLQDFGQKSLHEMIDTLVKSLDTKAYKTELCMLLYEGTNYGTSRDGSQRIINAVVTPV